MLIENIYVFYNKHYSINFILLYKKSVLWGDLYQCYSTVTCKVTPRKLGQHCVDSSPNLDEHVNRQCESHALLWRNGPSYDKT